MVQDGSGSFALPKESASSAVDPQAGSVAADGRGEKETLESIVEGTTEEKGGEGEEEEEQEEEEVEEEGDEGEGKGEEYEAGQPTPEDEGGIPWQKPFIYTPYHTDHHQPSATCSLSQNEYALYYR